MPRSASSFDRAAVNAALLALFVTAVACSKAPPTVRADPAPPPHPASESDAGLTLFVASASASPPPLPPPPPPAPPANKELDCWAWLNDEGSELPPFPHKIHPGLAMGKALDWAGKHTSAEQPSIWLENVHCPREKCIESADCWFHIRVDDSKSTAVSHLVAWVYVHARTGEVVDAFEPPVRPVK
jgi:hypothetical protein